MFSNDFRRLPALDRRAPSGPRLTLDEGVVLAEARPGAAPRLVVDNGAIAAEARD